MLRLFKNKKAEERGGLPSFLFKENVKGLVDRLKELSKEVKNMKIVNKLYGWSISYRLGLLRRAKVFDIYKERMNLKSASLTFGGVNIKEYQHPYNRNIEKIVDVVDSYK